MAIHPLHLAKLPMLAGKAGISKTAGATLARQAKAISARCRAPSGRVKGVLAGLIGFHLALIMLMAPGGATALEHQWRQRFGDASNQACTAMATDGAGNIILTGWFDGTIDFGAAPLTSLGGRDMFVAKFDATGNPLWSARFGDIADQTGTSVAVDGAGNVILTGSFGGTVDVGGGVLTAAGGQDILLVKFTPDGTHMWSMAAGGSGDQIGYGVAVDSAGNVILTGAMCGGADFGGGILTASGGQDVFLACFGADGVHHWSACYGDDADQIGRQVAIDGNNAIVLAGSFQGTVAFGGPALTSAGGKDIFLARFDPGAAHLWSRAFGGTLDQAGTSVAVETTGGILLAGYFAGSVDFGAGPLTSAGGTDVFLARFDAAGSHSMSMGFGDAADQQAIYAGLTSRGDILLTGGFAGSIDFGSGPLISAGGQDAFLAGLDSYGGNRFSRSFGDTADQAGSAVMADVTGCVIAAGNFAGTLDLGGDPLSAAGGMDIYLTAFGCPGDVDHDGDVDGTNLSDFIVAAPAAITPAAFAAHFGHRDCL